LVVGDLPHPIVAGADLALDAIDGDLVADPERGLSGGRKLADKLRASLSEDLCGLFVAEARYLRLSDHRPVQQGALRDLWLRVLLHAARADLVPAGVLYGGVIDDLVARVDRGAAG
jgi:hypothetical protein